MSDITAAMPEVVQALRSVGIDNPEVFTRPVYERCEECGGADQWLVPVTGGPGDRGRRHHSRACSKRADHDLRADVEALADELAKGQTAFETIAGDTSFRVRNVIAGRLRALLASSAPATAWDLHADLTAQVNDWDERVPRWVIARLRSILAAHTPPSATEPIHDDDCDSRGCTHCEVCGVGVLYGSRCSAHPMPDSSGEVALPATGVTSSDGYRVSMDLATGDISVSQWTPASSDGDRGLSEEERRSLGCQCTRLDDVWHHGRRCPVPAVERILAARTAQPEGVERVECDHPGIEHGPFSATGICPKCRHCKFIGHGPLCVDCFAPVSAEEVVGDE